MRLVRRAAGLVLLAGALACGGKKDAKTPPPALEVSVRTMAPSQVRDTTEYLGTLTSRQAVTLLPQVGGYVRRILVAPGARVEEGATLLEVDARQETAALQSAQAEKQSADANLALARQTRERSQALYKEGLLSAQELEQALARAQAAEASTRSASAAVSQRRVQLQYHAVRAPFAGTVGDILVRLGDYVAPTTPVTSISQSTELEVNVAVPAERARAVKPGTVIELLDPKGAVRVRSEVFFIADLADPRTQLVDLKARFANTVGLRPNEQVRARVVFGERQALQVPVLSVVRQSGQPFVFVVSDKGGKTLVQRRPVTLGPMGESDYVVEAGLQPNDRIAVSSLQALRDGAEVRVKPQVAAAAGAANEAG